MKLERIRKKRGELSLNITPLIDVVFQLLIFFLVATTFEDISSGISIDLPQSTVREIQDISGIRVMIPANKELVLSYKEGPKVVQLKVNKNRLKEEVKNRLAASTRKNVLISADKKTDYGFLVDVMTLVREAGATSLDLDTAEMK
ncbi:MAG: biopolymer transporter ExbD [Fusobacteriaceae bacterium]|jgi:biopolymer transport protein ExbD|nr:biopolymer transporter ExbD [Fusobacteriaceae bacterium]